MKYLTTSFGIIFSVLFLVLPISSAQARDLKADEVKMLFSNKTVFAYHEKKDFDIISYYTPNGTFKMDRKGEMWPGNWRIDDKGNMCLTLKDPYSGVAKKEKCRVISEKNGSYKKYKVKDNGSRVLIISYKKFIPGNQEGL